MCSVCIFLKYVILKYCGIPAEVYILTQTFNHKFEQYPCSVCSTACLQHSKPRHVGSGVLVSCLQYPL
jgi:hypothetical protein